MFYEGIWKRSLTWSPRADCCRASGLRLRISSLQRLWVVNKRTLHLSHHLRESARIHIKEGRVLPHISHCICSVPLVSPSEAVEKYLCLFSALYANLLWCFCTKCMKAFSCVYIYIFFRKMFNFKSWTVTHKISPPWKVFSHCILPWRLQVSTFHLCKLHIGSRLAHQLFVMSPSPAHTYSTCVKLRWNLNPSAHECDKLCSYIITLHI